VIFLSVLVIREACSLVAGPECSSRLSIESELGFFVAVAYIGFVGVLIVRELLRGLNFGVALCFRIGHGIGVRPGWCSFERIGGVLVV